MSEQTRTKPWDNIIRPGELLGETIIDRENWVEQLFSGIAAVGFVIALISAIAVLFNAFSTTKFLNEIGFSALPVLLLSGLLVALGTALRSRVDYFFVIDPESETFFAYHHYFGREWRTPICTFAEIVGLAVDGKRVVRSETHNGKTKRYYEWIYGLVLVGGNGKIVRLIDRETTDFSSLRLVGERLAGEFDTAIHGEAQRVLEVRRKPGATPPVELTFLERSSAEKIAIKVLQALLLGVILWVGYVVYS